jgi:CPA2 family monovalent cation:H+ antiporter-2
LENTQLVFEVGIIMMVAFIGAIVAKRGKQSVIIGYILAGMLIGPYISFTLFGYTYEGLVQDTEFLSVLSLFGLTLLMFFVGLEFSVSKLRRVKSPAIILALVNTGLDFFIGILIGYYLGWPIVDTVFLAGVFAMGSAAITGKILLEMQRTSGPDSEFLLGAIVVEDFVSMVIMTIAGGLIFKEGAADPMTFPYLVIGVIAFYAFFIFLALFIIPRSAKYLQKLKNEELFVLFALGLVFLSAALAEVAGVPAMIGAFFLGMIFAETKVSEHFEERITPFRDAFVAVFFVSFGMLINPAMFPQALPIVLIAIPLVLFSDLLLTSLTAYLLGFSARGSTFMGASMCGRGAESVMFASVGSSAVGVTKASIINPFAGLFCFTMSVLTPPMMRFSGHVVRFFSHVMPGYAKYGAALINRTLGKIMVPSSLRLFQRNRRMEWALVAYFSVLVAIMVMPDPWRLVTFLVGSALVAILYHKLELELGPVVRSINYSNLGVTSRETGRIATFVAGFIGASLYAVLATAYAFTQLWWSCFPVLAVYIISVLLLMKRVERRTSTPGAYRAPYPSSGPTTMFNASSIKATPFPKKPFPSDLQNKVPSENAVPVQSAYRKVEPEVPINKDELPEGRWKRL